MKVRGLAAGLGGLVVVAAALRFGTLADQSFWYDESLTVGLTKAPFGAHALGIDDQAEPPLYFLLAWVWTRIFGHGEAGLRSLSAVCGVLTVPVAYGIARTLVTRRAGLVAAALVAVSPALIDYSREARAYALFVLLSGLAVLFFVRALEESRGRDLAGWAISSALALVTHYFALFLVATQAVWLLVRHRERREVRAAVGGAALAVAALAPLALHQRANGVEWISNTPLGDRLEDAARALLLVDPRPSPFALVLELAWLAAAAVAVLRGDARSRRAVRVLLVLAGSFVVLPIVAAAFGSDYVLYRNLLGAWLPLAAVTAAACILPRRAWLALALPVAFCAAFLWQDYKLATKDELQRDDWRAVAHALGPPTAVRVVVVVPGWEASPLTLYERRLRVMGRSASVTELDTVTYQGPRPRPGPTTQPPPPPPFRAVRTIRVQRMIVTRYTAPRPTAVRAPAFPQRPAADSPLALVEAP